MSKQKQDRFQRQPIQPSRVRRIERGFAHLPNRFLHGGFFASLSHSQRSLYFFLVLASDRNGVSFYSYDRICTTLEMTLDDYLAARKALIETDLVAFDGTSFQVLSLPRQPVASHRTPLLGDNDLEREDPATIRRLIRRSLAEN